MRPLSTRKATEFESTATEMYGLSGIRTYDSSVPALEDSSCFTLAGFCDHQVKKFVENKLAEI
jgi:hypothetical protein